MKLSNLLTMFVVCSSLCVLSGCGSGGGANTESIAVEVENTADSTATLKTRLMEIAETGESGSVLAGLRESVEAVGGANKAELLELLTKLESESSPAKVKTLAKQMADKL